MSPTHRYRRFSSARLRGTWRRALATLASIGLVLGLAIGGGVGNGLANADPGSSDYTSGVAITMAESTGKTTTVGGTDVPVVASGGTVDITVWYYVRGNGTNNLTDAGMAGKDIVIDFSTIAGAISGTLNLSGNTVLNATGSSINTVAKTITLRVADSADLNDAADDAGRFHILLTLTNSVKSETIEPSWQAGGIAGGTVKLISLKNGDEQQPTASSIGKTSDATDYDKVTVTNGTVGIDSNAVFTYTLSMFTKDGIAAGDLASAKIVDTLPSRYLDYVQTTLATDVTAKLTTWTDGVPTTQDIAGDATDLVTFGTSATCTAADTSNACSTMTFDLSKIPDGGSTITEIPANSKLTVTYKVAIKSGQESNLKTDLKDSSSKTLQDLYDAIISGAASGTNFKVPVKNTATFPITVNSTNTVNRTVYLRGTVDPGKAFGKSADWSTRYVPTGDFTASSPTGLPVPITYSFKVDLANWSATNLPDLTSDDVIISDVLASGMEWDVSTPDGTGLTVSNTAGSFALTSGSADCTTDPASGAFCVQGQTLKINVGHDTSTNMTISAKAKFTAYPTATGSTTVTSDGSIAKRYENTAGFTYVTGKTYNASVTVNLVDRGTAPGGDGIQDTKVFEKAATNANNGSVSFVPGKPATVEYDLKIHPKPSGVSNLEDINPGGLIVTDTLSGAAAELFDLSDPSAITATVKYDGSPVSSSDYTVSGDNATQTVTVTFAEGWQPAGATGSPLVANPLAKDVIVHLKLTSKPIAGKQSIDLGDTAAFKSKGPEVYYWDEIKNAEITSWGNEVSTAKSVSDGGTFTASLRADLDGSGALVDASKIYVYQIEVIPHGGYGDGGAGLQTLTDTWPDEMAFCGIVATGGAATLSAYPTSCDAGTKSQTYTTGSGSVKAEYSDTGTKKIDISQAAGKFTWANEKPLYIYVAAQIDPGKFEINKPIVNKIGRSTATVVPLGSGVYPVTVEKQDTTFNPTKPDDQSPIQDDPDARFQLWRNGSLVVDGIFVCDGQLRAGTDCTDAKAVTVTSVGDYDLYEIVPPVGTGGEEYLRASAPLRITVSADGTTVTRGTTDPAVFWNDPRPSGTVSVGDLVWWDKDHNGKQDTGEPGLENVKLILCEVDGSGTVTSATIGGKTWSTRTNALGYYSFDGLPILTSGHEYTVCIDRTDSTTNSVLSPFSPTIEHAAGTTGDNDSSTWHATTDQSGQYPLTSDGARDPSLDFGFYKPSGGGGGGGGTTTPSTTPTSPVTTPTTAVTTRTAPTTPGTKVTVTPSSATSPTKPVPPTNVPSTSIMVSPDQCTDLVEHGFVPGETVTITVTGEHGQYEVTGVADENGDVAICLHADQPETIIIEVLGEHHSVVRQVVLGVEGLGYTGVPTVKYLAIALLLLGAGVALTLVARRGRRGRHFAK